MVCPRWSCCLKASAQLASDHGGNFAMVFEYSPPTVLDSIYRTWNFLDEVRKSVLEGDGEETNAVLPHSWSTTLRILETFG